MDLLHAVQGWAPEPVSRTAALHPEPATAFRALLDRSGPPLGTGDVLPPAWHWFSFLDHPASADLGPDGHPTAGHFLPPVPDRRRMFAGGRLRFHGPLRIGDTITRRTSVGRIDHKRGRSGEMLFVTLLDEFRRDGELLVVEEQDIVYRSEPAADRPPASPTPPAPAVPLPPAAGEPCVDVVPDEALLFRFSALTYNAHRIHYDHPYATGVEGYPALVVHGPLLALLLLEVPRRAHPERPVTTFSYRLTRPAFAGTPVRATGHLAGEEFSLSAAAAGAAPSITGTAVLAAPTTRES